MCAIVGAMSFADGGFKVTDPYITRMRDTMIHRGPDGAGSWVADDQRIGLGHHRLSNYRPFGCSSPANVQ